MSLKKAFHYEKPLKFSDLVSTYFNVSTMRLLTLILH
jgi:hypothetical protein